MRERHGPMFRYAEEPVASYLKQLKRHIPVSKSGQYNLDSDGVPQSFIYNLNIRFAEYTSVCAIGVRGVTLCIFKYRL